MEDYQANRKGKQQGGGLFGATPATSTSTSFSFGAQQPQQPQQTAAAGFAG